MMKRIVITLLVIASFMTICFTKGGNKVYSAENAFLWSSVPYEGEITADYIYVAGGYHSIDSGSVFPWGAVYIEDIRFIGDKMGDLVIEYADGKKDKIPLVFGYTMWFKNHWNNFKEPFKTRSGEKALSTLLKQTLYLNDAYEGRPVFSFRVKLNPADTVKKVYVADNALKNGTPVIDGLYFVKGEAPKKLETGTVKISERASFFETHTIDSKNPYPDAVKEALKELNGAVTVGKADLKHVAQYVFPSEHTGPRVLFSGNEFALTASNVFNYNLSDLKERVDDKGFLHESASENYSYSYDGFGTYSYSKNGSYYNCYYSRNKGILLLNHYGEKQKAKLAMNFANNALMYFKNNNLKLKGVDIPGHWTIHVNNPMAYSTGSYPTIYTKEKFGESYKNIGNSENDGHGMLMLSMYNTWKNSGSKAEWVKENFMYINEAAEWIVWNFAHPELSFIQDDVLYSESEGAAWRGYSLYCNIPVYYGLLAYADMAKVAGYEHEANEWYTYAERLKKGILKKFVTEEGLWDTSNDGYPRDPVLTSMLYYHGYDTDDMDKDFLKISLKTYRNDIKEVLKCGGYYAACGTGYDHGIITQNALLTDSLKDATKFLENLSLVCYSPNHPKSFSVPENYAVDTKLDIVRRQGDLGNLVQMSETLACYNLVMGVSPFDRESGVLKIMPRLPEGWTLDIEDFVIENTAGTVNIKSSYPSDGDYRVELVINHPDADMKAVKYRLGPFPLNTSDLTVDVNGEIIDAETYASGDYKWAWVTVNPADGDTSIRVTSIKTKKNINIKNLFAIIVPILIASGFLVVSLVLIYKNIFKGRKKNA